MEGYRGCPEMGVAESPVSTVSVGGEGHRCGLRVFGHHEGGVHRRRESAPRGEGGGGDWRGGGPWPTLECTFPLFFLLGGRGGVSFLFLAFPFVGMRGPL